MTKKPLVNPAEKFELQVFRAVLRAVEQGKLGLLEQSSKVFHRKQYYSPDRGSTIVTDVSVEVFVAEARDPSILWIWECKNYSGSVPVGDVEEFHAKLEQLGSDRTKGTIIASGSFQKAALEFAKSKGLGVARLISRDRIDWVFDTRQRRPSADESAEQILNAILDEETRVQGSQLFALLPDGVARSFAGIETYVQTQIRQWLESKSPVGTLGKDNESDSAL